MLTHVTLPLGSKSKMTKSGVTHWLRGRAYGSIVCVKDIDLFSFTIVRVRNPGGFCWSVS